MSQSEFSPIVPLAPDAVEAMQRAFDEAWNVLSGCGKKLSAREACDARVRLARSIFEQVRQGLRDPDRLSRMALSSLDTVRARSYL